MTLLLWTVALAAIVFGVLLILADRLGGYPELKEWGTAAVVTGGLGVVALLMF